MATAAQRAPGTAAKLNPYGLVTGELLPPALREQEDLVDRFNNQAEALTQVLDETKEAVAETRRTYRPEAAHEKVKAIHDKGEAGIANVETKLRTNLEKFVQQLERSLEPERIRISNMDPVVQEIRAESIRRALEALDPLARQMEVRTAASHLDGAGHPVPDRELFSAVDGAPMIWQRAMQLGSVLSIAREALGRASDPEKWATLETYRTALRVFDSNTATARQSLHTITGQPKGLVSPPASQAVASRKLA